jgi:hypothetical protein
MIAQAVVRLLNEDKKEFEKWAEKATDAYKKDKHLYVTVKDILKHKGVVG